MMQTPKIMQISVAFRHYILVKPEIGRYQGVGLNKRIFTLAVLCSVLIIRPEMSLAQCDPVKSTFTADYYENADTLQGADLRAHLNSLIRQKRVHSYRCVWFILADIDAHPQQTDHVLSFYTQRAIKTLRRVRSGVKDNDAWNREHIWAKSHGFKQAHQYAYTDLHHIRVADVSVNADRGNRDFDYAEQPHAECRECKTGQGTWEPPDSVKGDVARMMFYMDVRYEGQDDSKTPDLQLVQRTTQVGEAAFGKLCTLLKWHKQDAVNEAEKQRNEAVYFWQGNRNPFVDHPEWVGRIFKPNCTNT